MFNVCRRIGSKLPQTPLGNSFNRSFSANNSNGLLSKIFGVSSNKPVAEVPWFPSQISELNNLGLTYENPEEEVGKDHPGLTDQAYLKRREEIAQASLNHKMGDAIKYFDYTPEEHNTWERIYKLLRPLQEKYMSESFNKGFEKMKDAGIIKPNEVPQIEDLNQYLIKEANFRLKPVTGIMGAREFLNCLALRTFPCTQYIRHHLVPDYSPEPDIIHEVIGHVAMLANPDFCDLSQNIGLLSLGSSDESIKKLGALYWFTVEFGVCKEGNGYKGYGAGIASSIGEIKNFGEGKAQIKRMNPFKELPLDYPTMCVQPTYYAIDSFKHVGETLLNYGKNLPRPFNASFNAQTNRIEVDRKVKLVKPDEMSSSLVDSNINYNLIQTA